MALLSQGGCCSEQAGPGPAGLAWACSEDTPLEFIPTPFFLCTCQNQAKRSQTFTQVDSICEVDKLGATHLEATLGFQLRLQPPSLEWRGKVQKLVPGDAGAWVML